MNRNDIIRNRKERGKTQAEVAKACGMSRQYYSFIESGKRNISMKAAKKIAAFFGVDWKAFFEDENS